MTRKGSTTTLSYPDTFASHRVFADRRDDGAGRDTYASGELCMKLVESVQEGIAVLDRNLVCHVWNTFLERLTGIPRARILRRPILAVFPALAGHAWSGLFQAALEGKAGRGQAVRVADGNGVARWITPDYMPLRAAGGVDGVIVTVRDVTEEVTQQRKIDRLTRISAVLGSISSAIVRIRDRQLLLQEACRIATTHGAFATAWIGLIDPASGAGRIVAAAGGRRDYFDRVQLSIDPDAPTSGRPANVAMRTRRPVVCNDIATDPSFAAVRDELLAKGYRSVTAFPLIAEDRVLGVLTLFADSAGFFDEPEMKLLNQLTGDISFGLDYILKDERLRYLAYYDPVTGLPNRDFFVEQLGKKLQVADRKVDRLTLCVGDVRRLGGINDSFGRDAGDAVLRDFAQRLASRLRNPESLAYLGNGRFASIVSEAADLAELAHRIGTNIDKSATEPFVVDGSSVATTSVVGVAIYPDDGATAEALLRSAEAAVAQAKAANVPYLFYKASRNGEVADGLRLESSLRRALERDEFVLHYQSKVCSADGTIIGVEALLRWQDPERGLVYPDQFIPVLESTGLIVDAGRWVIARALADFHACRAAGRPMPRIAVNVSVKHLQHERFTADLRELAARDCCIGEALEIEITESMVMENIDRQIATLSAIKALGIRVAIDDFGTGYSSLSYLAKLPIDTLKVDRSFILSMITDPASMTIVSSIISLAHSLGLNVVAEGVETEDHAALLRRMGCDEMQGYLFSHPLPLQQIRSAFG